MASHSEGIGPPIWEPGLPTGEPGPANQNGFITDRNTTSVCPVGRKIVVGVAWVGLAAGEVSGEEVI